MMDGIRIEVSFDHYFHHLFPIYDDGEGEAIAAVETMPTLQTAHGWITRYTSRMNTFTMIRKMRRKKRKRKRMTTTCINLNMMSMNMNMNLKNLKNLKSKTVASRCRI